MKTIRRLQKKFGERKIFLKGLNKSSLFPTTIFVGIIGLLLWFYFALNGCSGYQRIVLQDDGAYIFKERPIGYLILSIREIDPNSSHALVDVRYITSDITHDKYELLLTNTPDKYSVSLFPFNSDESYAIGPLRINTFLLPESLETPPYEIRAYSSNDLKLKLGIVHDARYFPFDKYNIDARFLLRDEDGAFDYLPKIFIEIKDSYFSCSNHLETKQGLDDDGLVVDIHNTIVGQIARPLYVQALIFVVVFLITFLVLWSCIQAINLMWSSKTQWEIISLNLSLLIALPSLRNVVVPPNLRFAPLFDFVILMIWSVSLLVLGIMILGKNVVKKSKKEE